MAYGLVIDDNARVAAWVYATYNLFPIPVNRALGIVEKDGVLVGGVLLQNYNGANIELSYYGPWTLSAGIIRTLAHILISEFNVARVTVITSKKKKRLLRSLQRFGWCLEGAQRCFYGSEDCTRNTGIRFVMFRDQLNRIAGLPNKSPEQKQG
jgi:hypothetical protein